MKNMFRKMFFVLSLVLMQATSFVAAGIPCIVNLYDILQNNDIGSGQSLYYSGWTKSFYLYGPNDDLHSLAKCLWDIEGQEEKEKLCVKKKGPFSTITPEIFGQLMGYVYTGQIKRKGFLVDPAVEKWIKRWADLCINSSDSEKEIVRIVKVVINALEHNETYMPRTVEAMLWAFFESKFKGVAPIKACLRSIAKIVKERNGIFTNGYRQKILGDLFYDNEHGKKAYINFEKHIESIDAVRDKIVYMVDNYDLALHSLIKRVKINNTPEQVPSGINTYEYAQGKRSPKYGTCVEGSFLDLLSILWYDPKLKKYNDQLLPDNVRNGEGFSLLRKFLEKFDGGCTPENMVRDEVITNWLKTISNMKGNGILYLKEIGGKKYEVESCIENIIKFFNWFYGLDKKSIKEFGSALSLDGKRKIEFRLENVYEFDYKPEFNYKPKKKVTAGLVRVKITYTDPNYDFCEFNVKLNVQDFHTDLVCAERGSISSDVYTADFIKSLQYCVYQNRNDSNKLAPFLLLLFNKNLLDQIDTYDSKFMGMLYYSLYLRSSKVKLAVLNHALKHGLLEDKGIKDLIYEIIRRLDNENYVHKYGICKNIINAGAYAKGYKYLDSYISKNSSESFIAACYELPVWGLKRNAITAIKSKSLVGLAKKLIRQVGTKDINREINGSTALIMASKRGYQSLVKKILEYPNVEIDKKDPWLEKTALGWALLNKHNEVAAVIREHKRKRQAKTLFFPACDDDYGQEDDYDEGNIR
ncbi:ankyrin repeat domain-containing protein [Candidatus Dependentiae bacterium]